MPQKESRPAEGKISGQAHCGAGPSADVLGGISAYIEQFAQIVPVVTLIAVFPLVGQLWLLHRAMQNAQLVPERKVFQLESGSRFED